METPKTFVATQINDLEGDGTKLKIFFSEHNFFVINRASLGGTVFVDFTTQEVTISSAEEPFQVPVGETDDELSESEPFSNFEEVLTDIMCFKSPTTHGNSMGLQCTADDDAGNNLGKRFFF